MNEKVKTWAFISIGVGDSKVYRLDGSTGQVFDITFGSRGNATYLLLLLLYQMCLYRCLIVIIEMRRIRVEGLGPISIEQSLTFAISPIISLRASQVLTFILTSSLSFLRSNLSFGCFSSAPSFFELNLCRIH
jgi:hypothetical protein